ncbi:MAG: TetR/AcrR family transcriptional regulator [Bacteroidetes bacterium]|nr:TetR/AcrR family transcriptional regulator [Bacteroidota bacterium]
MEAREKVINRACELFPVVGIRNVTMDGLAADLGMSKRTIYELFGQKDNLVLETFRQMITRENNEMLQIISDSEHVVEALFRIMKHKRDKRLSVSPLFIEDIGKYIDRIQEMFYTDNSDLSRYSASFVLLREGMSQGIFRSEINIAIVDNFIHEMMNVIHVSTRIKALNPGDHELLVNIFIPYFRGICTERGVKLMDEFFSASNIII